MTDLERLQYILETESGPHTLEALSKRLGLSTQGVRRLCYMQRNLRGRINVSLPVRSPSTRDVLRRILETEQGPHTLQELADRLEVHKSRIGLLCAVLYRRYGIVRRRARDKAA